MFKRFCFVLAFLTMQFVLSGLIFADELTSPTKEEVKPANVEKEAPDGSKAEATNSQPKSDEKITVKPETVETAKKAEEKSPFSGKVRLREQYEEYEGEKKPRLRTRIRADFNFVKELTDFNIGFGLRTGTGLKDSDGSYSAGNGGNIDVTEMYNLGVFVNQAFIAYKASDNFWFVAGRYGCSVGKSAGFSIMTSEISFEDLYAFDGISFFTKPVSDLVFWFGITPFFEKRQSSPKDNIYTVLASTQLSYTAKLGDNKLQVGAGFWGFIHPENLPEIQTGFGYGSKASPDGDDEYLLTGEFFAVLSLGSMLSFKFHGMFNIGATDDPLSGYFQIAYGTTKNTGDLSIALQLIYIERYAFYHKLLEFGVNFRGFQFIAKYVISKGYTVGVKIIGENKIIASSSLTGILTFKFEFEANY